MKRGNEYTNALKDAFPVITGYFTVSFVFGISCINLDLPIWFPALMSLIVYAGASQFSFLVLYSGGASLATIMITTFLINLRHMLMSIYIANLFNLMQIDHKFRWLYGYGLTDESFAFHSTVDKKDLTHRYFLWFNFYCHFSWVMGSIIGAWLASETRGDEFVSLKYTLTAMMIYVLVLLTDTTTTALVAIIAIATMILLTLVSQSHFNIFISTFVASGAGLWLKKKT